MLILAHLKLKGKFISNIPYLGLDPLQIILVMHFLFFSQLFLPNWQHLKWPISMVSISLGNFMLIKTIIKKIVSYVNCRKVLFIIKLNGRHNTVFLTLLNNKNPKILIVLLPIDQIVLALKFLILFLFWFCIFFPIFPFSFCCWCCWVVLGNQIYFCLSAPLLGFQGLKLVFPAMPVAS